MSHSESCITSAIFSPSIVWSPNKDSFNSGSHRIIIPCPRNNHWFRICFGGVNRNLFSIYINHNTIDTCSLNIPMISKCSCFRAHCRDIHCCTICKIARFFGSNSHIFLSIKQDREINSTRLQFCMERILIFIFYRASHLYICANTSSGNIDFISFYKITSQTYSNGTCFKIYHYTILPIFRNHPISSIICSLNFSFHCSISNLLFCSNW